MSASSRSALPWPAVVAATILALLAAGGVLYFAAGGDDGDGDAPRADGTLDLTPADDLDDDADPLQIEFTDVDDSTGTLAGIQDGPMVVNFFASWCSPCIKEMPDFETVSEELGEQVQFVGLAVEDRPEDASRIVEETGVTYRWSRDVRGNIANAAGAILLPATMFVSADGEIVEVHPGAVDAEQLRDLIEEHLGVAA